MALKSHSKGVFWVSFVATGDRFPIRYYETSDMFTVELPSGVFEGEYLRDLRRELKSNFEGVRITK